MNRTGKSLLASICLLLMFALWTAAICFVDVRAIGPQGSSVGFARLNLFFHNLTGVHFALYRITDWLGLVPVFWGMGFGMVGLSQWYIRKRIVQVDRDILALGGLYLVTLIAYFFFEIVIINYRPVLIDGILSASYPSSTTMLVICVMPTALMQCNRRVKSKMHRRIIAAAIILFIAFMVIGRLLSGVHWLTDIVGGSLLSSGLVLLYSAVGIM